MSAEQGLSLRAELVEALDNISARLDYAVVSRVSRSSTDITPYTSVFWLLACSATLQVYLCSPSRLHQQQLPMLLHNALLIATTLHLLMYASWL